MGAGETVEDSKPPVSTDPDLVFWDDAAFIRRVKEEADKLGISLSEVYRRARLAKDYLGKNPQAGRNVLAIEKIAAVLGVEPAYLSGWATIVQVKESRQTPEQTQLQALGLAANIAAHVYLVLNCQQTPKLPDGIDKDQLADLITQLLNPPNRPRRKPQSPP